YRTHHSSTRRLFRKRLANCHPTGEAERAHFYEQAYNLLDSVSRTPPLIHSNRHQTYLALLYHKATSEKPESLPKAHVDYQNYGYARLPTILLFGFHQRKYRLPRCGRYYRLYSSQSVQHTIYSRTSTSTHRAVDYRQKSKFHCADSLLYQNGTYPIDQSHDE